MVTPCGDAKYRWGIKILRFSTNNGISQKLLFRLQSYGVDGCLLAWLSNFLSHRILCTRVGNSLSSELELISGIIQGSGIGPLLFVSYINELAAVLGRCNVIVKLFADDLKMYTE